VLGTNKILFEAVYPWAGQDCLQIATDGNGRTIMIVHGVTAQCAGFSIDSAAPDKAHLSALTKELDELGGGHLDSYRKPSSARPSRQIVWQRKLRLLRVSTEMTNRMRHWARSTSQC
jgi:fido (protein-threonine AMPylation protein)